MLAIFSEKDWNALARKNTSGANPIGSKHSSMRRHSQRSLRRRMVEQANEGLKMSQGPILG